MRNVLLASSCAALAARLRSPRRGIWRDRHGEAQVHGQPELLRVGLGPLLGGEASVFQTPRAAVVVRSLVVASCDRRSR
jgi:hypothetical protein